MANKFQIKRTSVSLRTPNTTEPSNTSFIDAGELAVNLIDKKVFTSDGTDFFELGSNLSNLSVTANATISYLESTTTNTSSLEVSTGATILGSLSVSSNSNLSNLTSNGVATFTNTITVGNNSVNTFVNSSSIIATNISGNGSGITSVNALTLEGNTVLDLRNYFANASLLTSGTLDTLRLPSTVNVADVLNVGTTFTVNTSVLSIGNSTVNTIINSSSVSTDLFYGNGFYITSISATTLGGNTITDILNYASNADNITTGTLNTDRFPSVVNVATEINVGGNLQLTTSLIHIGNSSVNTQINSTSISTTNFSGNGASITSVDAASVGGNTASDLRTYADNQAGNAYSNAVSAIVENAIAFSIALG